MLPHLVLRKPNNATMNQLWDCSLKIIELSVPFIVTTAKAKNLNVAITL